VGAAALAAPDPTMLTKVAGGVLVAHGADTVQAGLRQAATGVVKETLTGTAIRKTAEAAGASPGTAALISAGGEMAIGLGAGVVATRGTAAAAAQAEARFQAEATRQARNAAIERGEYSVSGGSGANAESRGIGAQYVYDARAARHRDTTTGRFVAQRDLPYPPNAGFASSTRNPLTEGTIVERFGRPSGRFASDPGASISARGMPPGSEALLRHRYEVMKQVEVQMGPAAPVPAFGAEGGGIQYMFDRPISELISQGILKEVK